MGPVVLAALQQARELGLVGETPLVDQLAHAAGFALVVESFLGGHDHVGVRLDPSTTNAGGVPSDMSTSVFRGRWVDLGSGGGLPGLVLADRWSSASGVLLDASARSGRFLAESVRTMGLASSVRVVTARAEEVGREAQYRGSFDVAVARSFGPPAVVAECAAPLLRAGGILVVSEPPPSGERAPGPPSGPQRWPTDALAALGLEPVGEQRLAYGYQVLRQFSVCPDRFPRRVGIPRKRPLY